MSYDIIAVASAISAMDLYLQKTLAETPKKIWKNTHVYHQLKRRKSGDIFTISDHIRGMVYAMISSGIAWERVEAGIDLDTGKILPLDEAFHQYDPTFLLNSNPSDLRDAIKELGIASPSTLKQMTALVTLNIGKLQYMEAQSGSIDNYYQMYMTGDRPINNLVNHLASPTSQDKFVEMGEALTSEYLKNVGYDLAKPDRHICRILSRYYIGCSENENVSVFEALDIISKLATEMKKPAAEVDYILWSYCAKGYGEICTVNHPKCEICAAREICNRESKCLDLTGKITSQ